jgi:hypothetical protein
MPRRPRTQYLFNPVTPKQVVIRGRSPESLQELVPVAEEALYAMGATSVVTEFHGSIHPYNHFAVFVVEGLGEGKRWSSGQKKEFTAQVKSLLLPGDARPNFRNATGSDITEIETAVPSGPMSWGIPDSDRTQRAKRKSREMRKVFRRPNPRR